jgi:hypothetical protein
VVKGLFEDIYFACLRRRGIGNDEAGGDWVGFDFPYLPAASAQVLNQGRDDRFHAIWALRGHVQVATTPVNQAMCLNRVPTRYDKPEGSARVQDVLEQAPVQVG